MKFTMAQQMLKSSLSKYNESDNSTDASHLMEKAQANFSLAINRAHEKNWLECNAIIDSVIRDLTTASQILSKKAFNQNVYRENLKRVEAFILPEWSEDISQQDRDSLDKESKEIDKLIEQAKLFASNEEFEQGTSELYKAYRLKSALLQKNKHKSTIIYGYLFDTPEEEYEYMLSRNQHFQGLVEKVLNEKAFDEQTSSLINVYLDKSKSGTFQAYSFQLNNQHKEAIQVLDQSIQDLSNALKVMGIRI
ncbi:MAG: hypothetical protein H8E21_05745 [Gammaproteobacteria bacterium]|nr:hypothetical protein [Gammaproteobacteria bacterium]